MKIFNSLSRTVEDFTPISKSKVGIYTCGPTVYDYMTIGNWRTYTLGDFLVRTLQYLGYNVDYIMNITDVGHLTGDNLGDADTGEDRLEKGARREGKTAWAVATFYTDDFLQGFKELNLTEPRVFSKATDHIVEQIKLVQAIEKRGFAYLINDGVYFDTRAYEKTGHTYGELSTLDQIQEGARVEPNPEKKDPRDFALWKFSPKKEKRDMEWESPWAPPGARGKVKGFPGWHIECSAMSMKYLGKQFDIHVGGEDLRSTHHPNEIAQSEAATGQSPFVHYWIHGSFLQIDGGRMGKSLGNAYKLQDLKKHGYEPMELRYFFLTGHYRKQINFTWESLDSAAKALGRLRNAVTEFRHEKERTVLSEDKLEKIEKYKQRFLQAISTDLHLPEALGIVWEVVKSNIPGYDKFDLLMEFDQVLGLGLGAWESSLLRNDELPKKVQELIQKRDELRTAGEFDKADTVRDSISRSGYEIEDTPDGTKVKKL